MRKTIVGILTGFALYFASAILVGAWFGLVIWEARIIAGIQL